MPDLLSVLKSLHRPRLLIRAARLGLSDYNRARDLKRLLRGQIPNTPNGTVQVLVETEAALEDIRRAGDARYSIARHVEVLIALMAEAQLLPETSASAPAAS